MQIIIPPKEWTEGDRGKAIERELREGLQLKKAYEDKRRLKAAQEAQMHRTGKTVPGLGKLAATIPEWEYFRLKQKYGKEVHSRDFIRYFQKKYPELAGAKV